MSASSSLARAFTKRQKRPEVSQPMPFREGQPKFASGTIHRSKISAPVELISTTNLLAYTAPDLPGQKGAPRSSPKKSTSSSSSFRSADESDATNSTRAPSTSVTSPDLSSTDVSPVASETSSLFGNGSIKHSNTVASSHRSQSSASSASKDAPAVPQRSLSRSNKSHPELVRQRSKPKMAPPSTSLSHTHSARINQDHYSNEPTPHPFGKELEQVNEVAEEFGAGQMVADEEERIFKEKGLLRFSVESYILEVEKIYQHIFPEEFQKPLMKEAWI